MKFLAKLFGSKNDREIKRIRKVVDRINSFEEKFSVLPDEDLRLKTKEFQKNYEKGLSLDQLLPEAFAVVREAAKRTLGLRHFDV
ncbi:MAG: preprotein translocase subunit SecA, partial [Porticoccus sp.]